MSGPKYGDLLEPHFIAMHELGGSASIAEIEEKVAEMLGLSDSDLEVMQNAHQTKFGYRLAWARTYLKKYEVLTNSARGIWVLTPKGQKLESIKKKDVQDFVKNQKKDYRVKNKVLEPEELEELEWKDKALEVVKNIRFDAFERLCQRILRESGFTHVEVTGKCGDEGVDGKGIVRISGMLSFHVIFQCKRYKGSVSPSVVRDFRGAMVGRADKGLIMTTGTFTRDAQREAQRDGASPIDLIDGEDLVLKLKELGLGINVKQKIVEEVTVDENYFKDI